MRGELSEAVSVPQVFEPGARVAWDGGGIERVLTEVRDGRWRGVRADGQNDEICRADAILEYLRVVAPAPHHGQRWTGDGPSLFVAERHAALCCQDVLDRPEVYGDAASIARWLLEHGYSYAGPASAPSLPVAPPVASIEPPAPPSPAATAPWTLADARRLILDAIRSAEPRHPAAFTAALCSMAEFSVPGERLIRATSAALGTAEDRLPERGAIAPWQEELAARAAREALERAFGRGNVPLRCVNACARYLDRRAGR